VSVRLLVGIEWQKQINKLQLLYGFDTGLRYYEEVDPASITWRTSTGEVLQYSTVDRSEVSIPLYGFVGVKYYFNQRISISMESSLAASFNWLTYQNINYDNSLNEIYRSLEAKRKAIQFSTDYLRYINLSLYF
ncbi:MAG: hypothetical protein AAFO82_12680, partial [Bacteroidota bacterium]